MDGARVLGIGIAYKPNINDCRESPALAVLELLRMGGQPMTVPQMGRTLALSRQFVLACRALNEEYHHAPSPPPDVCRGAIDRTLVGAAWLMSEGSAGPVMNLARELG